LKVTYLLKKICIVAVSGGPDSLALSFLAKIYSIKKSIDIKYFIVDHKLRKNSTLEARYCSKKIKKFFYKIKYFNLER
jgi:tRNA(Ile)-lysidine synthase